MSVVMVSGVSEQATIGNMSSEGEFLVPRNSKVLDKRGIDKCGNRQ